MEEDLLIVTFNNITYLLHPGREGDVLPPAHFPAIQLNTDD
jgi:hypothetical protein